MIYKSILEGIYIIFMFNIFKTCKYIHHPFEQLLTDHPFLKHPISDDNYTNKICHFGKISSYFIFIWLISRIKIKKVIRNKINSIIWIIIAIVSFVMNMNAFVYLIPIFILELDIFKKIKFDLKHINNININGLFKFCN